MPEPIQIIIADDHLIFREGFRVLLKKQTEIRIVAEAENGSDLLQKVEKHRPDIVITDIQMPGMDGVQATRQLHQDFPDVKVIALSTFNDDNLIVEMLEAGAKGYLLKNTTREELAEAIKTVHGGGSFFSTSTPQTLARLIGKSSYDPFVHLPALQFSEKEKEIMKLICMELSSKQIAPMVHLTKRTIENYREKIQEKIGAKNMVGIALYAVKKGIVNLEEL